MTGNIYQKSTFIKNAIVYCVLLLVSFLAFSQNVYSLARTTPATYCPSLSHNYFQEQGLCCLILGYEETFDINNPDHVESYCTKAPDTPNQCPSAEWRYNPETKLCEGSDIDTQPPKQCDYPKVFDPAQGLCCIDSGPTYTECEPSTNTGCDRGYHYDEDKKLCVENTAHIPSSETNGDPITLSAEPCDYNGSKGIKTALGCIPYEPVSLIGWVLRWAIGVGGGIAFLLMAFASYQLMTSAGNPERLKAGQEMFVSAGAGLLFIIFSVFLLQLIGADILQIPGFNP